MSGFRLSAVFALSLLACATADNSGGNNTGDPDGSNNSTVDAPTVTLDGPPGTVDAPTVTIDAPTVTIDAPMGGTMTLSQSSSNVITALNSVACSNNLTGYTLENSYYRVFRLADHGITTAFTATRVDFGVEEATAGAGTSQTVQVRVHTLNGAFVRANLTTIAGQTVSVNNQSLGTVSVPLSPPGVAPAGSTIVVEVFSPDGTTIGNSFYLGSNASAETQPSYIRAPGCNSIIEPATFASLSQPQVHLVMSVTGTY